MINIQFNKYYSDEDLFPPFPFIVEGRDKELYIVGLDDIDNIQLYIVAINNEFTTIRKRDTSKTLDEDMNSFICDNIGKEYNIYSFQNLGSNRGVISP